MQAIAPVTVTQLLSAGQQPLMKLESYISGEWKDFADLSIERLLDGELEDWAGAEDLTYYTEFDGGTPQEGVFQESTVVHSGLYSARLLTTAGGDFAGFYQDITLTPDNTCTFSAWYIRAAHASSVLRLYIRDSGSNVFLNSGGTWQAGATFITLAVAAAWTNYSITFTVHSDYSDYRIRFYKSHGAGGAISFYVDDLSVEESRNISLGVTEGGNYFESATVSLGGATMTPNPVAGKWGAALFNADGIFHPQHPTSPFRDYLKTERLVRLSIGATYGGTDYYWQQVIGYMDEPKFSSPDYKIAISGGDYMKRLRETELSSPGNYWGSSATFNSISSDGLQGSQLYAELDAMDIDNEANNVANWVATDCDFNSFADVGGGSTWVGRITNPTGVDAHVTNTDVGTAVLDTKYKVTFQHRITGGDGSKACHVEILQAAALINYALFYPTDSYAEGVLIFTATANAALEMRFYARAAGSLSIDQISIKEFVDYWDRYYELPGASTGPYYVTIDGEPVWQGEGDEEWKYEEDSEAGPDPPAHPAKIVYFNLNKVVAEGVNNLIVSYFEQQVPENVVADLLVLAGLYADQAAALAAMQYDATGKTIDMVWFTAGTTCLNAIKKICEFCDYRFYFRYDGVPFFKPKPTAGAAVFTFTDPKHVGSIDTYQDINEIKNRIVIKGLKQSDTVGKEETMPSDLTGESSDATSITAYGERTLTINNHLFQTQAGIDTMCDSLLAEYKDPKWYSTLKLSFLPVPLEMGDNIQWEERLSPTLDITQTGIIRDIKINNFNTTYKCVHT